jgi:hypothetical protein
MTGFRTAETAQLARDFAASPTLPRSHRPPGAGTPAENPLLAVVRALARAEAHRLFRLADKEGRVALPLGLFLAVLALVGLVILRAVVR